MTTIVAGTVYQVPMPGELQVMRDAVIEIADDGVISAVHAADTPEAESALARARSVHRLSAQQRLLPGLVDTHIHAPQWPQLGTGLDIPLDRWLFEYTFPLEARYADRNFAESVWSRMVPALLRHGTTTAVYYSTIHEESTLALAEACVSHGQRAFVGRVGMDHPDGTPDWYRDGSARTTVESSARSVEAIRGLRSPLVEPVITPRFAPACSDGALRGLGELAASTGALVQTHCSESDWEHGHALERFGASDTVALQSFGLVRPNTVLAHGDHVSDHDMDVIAAAGAGIAHCPLSNAYFANAVLPVRRALSRGVRIGLGSDVAGGAAPGLLVQCAHAVTASRYLEDGVDPELSAAERGVPGSRIDVVTAFHLATKGGADLLGIPVGLLEPGRRFDAFVVECAGRYSGLDAWEGIDDDARLFEKIVRLASHADITRVWVDGRVVHTS